MQLTNEGTPYTDMCHNHSPSMTDQFSTCKRISDAPTQLQATTQGDLKSQTWHIMLSHAQAFTAVEFSKKV
jgi:hypothetical protein